MGTLFVVGLIALVLGMCTIAMATATDKSQVGFYTGLAVEILRAIPPTVPSGKSLDSDTRVLISRVNHEGLGFLTKTLPALGKALDRSLETMVFEAPPRTRMSRINPKAPAFLQGAFNLIVDPDGSIRSDVDPEVITYLRQVCFAFYKLDLPHDKSTESELLSSFIATDEELAFIDFDDSHTQQLVEGASRLIDDVLLTLEPMSAPFKHGPGAVATGERFEDKWAFKRIYRSLSESFPFHKTFMVGSERELMDRRDWVDSLVRLDSPTAKIVLVPKDSRGPRIISCEPLEIQYVQQALGVSLARHLEYYTLTSGQINFTDQKINRILAFESSKTRRWATLDLKDASDRVSLDLVRKLFARRPEYLKLLESSRSSATRLPDGRIVQLNKFAPMGSALCFPIEALCFWAIAVASILAHSQRDAIKEAAKSVYVYGDDIIVPVDQADFVMDDLERVGLKVNRAKSFLRGFFRESCGMDAFKGVDVTPIRVKTRWTGRGTDGSAFSSYTAYANSFNRRSWSKSVSDYLFTELEKIYGPIPMGLFTSPFPCRETDSFAYATYYNKKRGFQNRWNADYHRLEFRMKSIRAKRRPANHDGWERLLSNLTRVEKVELKLGWAGPSFLRVQQDGEIRTVDLLGDPSEIVDPRSIKIKRGWMPL